MFPAVKVQWHAVIAVALLPTTGTGRHHANGPRTEEDTVLVSLPILVQCQWKHRHNMCEQGRKVMLEISAHVFFLEIAGAF